MDQKGVLRVQGRRNELGAEVEGKHSVLVAAAVAVGVAANQVMIHVDMKNHMTAENCSEKVIVEVAVVEQLDKAMMDVVAVG
jgi:hypothetical protein